MTNIRFTNTNNNIAFDIACFDNNTLCHTSYELTMISADGEITIIKNSNNLNSLIAIANSLKDIIKDLTDPEALPTVEALQVLYGI